MLRFINTLLRGAAAEAEEALFDAHAVKLLEQNIRDANDGFEASKQDLARVLAQETAAMRAIAEFGQRIAEMETKARAALAAGDNTRAETLAGRIAVLEDERTAHDATKGRCREHAKRLRAAVDEAARRLSELRRGLGTVRAVAAIERAEGRVRARGLAHAGAIREAEDTLRRIHERQSGNDDFANALDAVQNDLPVAGAAGAEPGSQTDPKDVLERLKRQQ